VTTADTGGDVKDRPADDAAAATPPDDPGRGRPRNGTLSVVGLIVAVAVVAATATIVLARLPAGTTQAERQEVPTTLSDGRAAPPTPEAVAGAIGLPVVVADRLDDAGDIATGCEMDPRTVLGGHVTPDHATVLARTSDPPMSAEIVADPTGSGPLNVACVNGWRDGAWQRISLSAVPARGPESQFPAWMCCDENGNSIVHHVLDVPSDAAWLLEDKGHYAVAYDLAGLHATGIVSGVSSGGTEIAAHIWWVDGDGVIVGEVYRGG
jgi:hypothetical protein